jgi:hypothetical protein
MSKTTRMRTAQTSFDRPQQHHLPSRTAMCFPQGPLQTALVLTRTPRLLTLSLDPDPGPLVHSTRHCCSPPSGPHHQLRLRPSWRLSGRSPERVSLQRPHTLFPGVGPGPHVGGSHWTSSPQATIACQASLGGISQRSLRRARV